MKYVILADSSVGFNIPRQLTIINGEVLIKRTIRLLKENGIKDIIITSHDKRFNDLGVERYEPLYNDWDAEKKTGYWLSAFPTELLNEPICFLFGDVYYSENAIKEIINHETNSTLFFCAYQNKCANYIKHHDEPLGYKVYDYKLFKKHIVKVKKAKDEGKCCREPIVWELYRSINNQDINIHVMTNNYVVINDESCDIDTLYDIIKLEIILGGNDMIKCEVIKDFSLNEFKKLSNIIRKNKEKNKDGELYKGDVFECEKETADYLSGNNDKKEIVIKVIEVIPEIEDGTLEHPYKTIMPEQVEKIKSNRKKKSKK